MPDDPNSAVSDPSERDRRKIELRKGLRALRRRLAAETPDAAVLAARRLPATLGSGFRTIAAYHAVGAEMDPRPVLEALARQAGPDHSLALPVTLDRDTPLEFRVWSQGAALIPDAMGAPAPGPEAAVVRPDFVIAPLLAFDGFGGRLGQGGGHYDRTLAALRSTGPVFVMGLAYAGQEVSRLALAPHDQRLDAILTDQGYTEFE